MKLILLLIAFIFLASFILLFIFTDNKNIVRDIMKKEEEKEKSKESKLIIYKTKTCGCCLSYVNYLKSHGYEIEIIEKTQEELEKMNNELNIPIHLRSCHIVKSSKYFISGHIPNEALVKLFNENPDIDGLALPGMPPGSPGMAGIKTMPFKIYALKNGNAEVFMLN